MYFRFKSGEGAVTREEGGMDRCGASGGGNVGAAVRRAPLRGVWREGVCWCVVVLS